MTKVWKFSQPANENGSTERKGWVFAKNKATALRLVGHPDAAVSLAEGKIWPGKDIEMVVWSQSCSTVDADSRH